MPSKTSAYTLPTVNWRFIAKSSLRRILERDYDELKKLVKAKTRKSTVIMCGSILEAALSDVLSDDEAKAKEVLRLQIKNSEHPNRSVQALNRWGLEDLINVASEIHKFPGDIQQLAQILRRYRNLIHPGVEDREAVEIDEQLVQLILPLFVKVLKTLQRLGERGDKVATFFNQITQKRDAEIARRGHLVFDWIEAHGWQHSWTDALSYLPTFDYDGERFAPIVLEVRGQLIIRFGYLKSNHPVWASAEWRETLRQKLNNIKGVLISRNQVNAFPSIDLAVLDSDSKIEALLNVIHFVQQSLSSSDANPPLEAQ